MEITRHTRKIESLWRNLSSFGPKTDLINSIKLLFNARIIIGNHFSSREVAW